MHGYAEQFDFTGQTITGWALGAAQVIARMDGAVIGAGIPDGTRQELEAVFPGAQLFAMSCTRSFTALDIISGRLQVMGINGDEQTPMKLTTSREMQLRSQALASLGGGVAWSRTEIEGVAQNVKSGLMSPQLLPAGLLSDDKTSMLGLNGQIFLVGGSNNLKAQYDGTYDFGPGGHAGVTEAWLDLFGARREQCEARGVRYFQTIIPEKQTAMPHYFPGGVDGPTPVFGAIEKALKDDLAYISGMSPFESWAEPDAPYLTTGSHFSASGAKAMFRAIVDSVDPSVGHLLESIQMDEERYEVEDLSERFYGLPLHSLKAEPSAGQFEQWATGLTLTHQNIPTGHIGRRFSWKNTTAPSPLRVLVFGNSFFGHGAHPGQLAWWGNQFFGEFHHVWNPDFQWDIVDELKPDVVLGQTIERFVCKVAAS